MNIISVLWSLTGEYRRKTQQEMTGPCQARRSGHRTDRGARQGPGKLPHHHDSAWQAPHHHDRAPEEGLRGVDSSRRLQRAGDRDTAVSVRWGRVSEMTVTTTAHDSTRRNQGRELGKNIIQRTVRPLGVTKESRAAPRPNCTYLRADSRSQLLDDTLHLISSSHHHILASKMIHMEFQTLPERHRLATS